MNINDMMGLLQQMSKMRNERSDTGPPSGRRMERIPGRLGGSIVNKGLPAPSSAPPEMTRGEIAGQVMQGGAANDIAALQEMISVLRGQLREAGITPERRTQLLQQIVDLENKIEQLSQPQQPGGRGGVLRMGTSSSGPMGGGGGTRWPGWLAGPIGGYGGGGMGTGGGGGSYNPFGWMGGGGASPTGQPLGYEGSVSRAGGKRKKR